MKKEYMKPQIEVVKVNTIQLLSDSNKVNNVAGNGDFTLVGGGAGGGRSRGCDDWDEE